MSTKRIIIIIGVILLVTLGVWAYQASKNNGGTSSGSQSSGGIGSLFPFFGGNSGTSGTTTDSGNTDGGLGGGTTETPTGSSPLKRISNKVVGGYTIITPLGTTSPVTAIRKLIGSIAPTTPSTASTPITVMSAPKIRFMERGTGYIYDTDALGVGEKKLTGTAIVRALDGLFADNGASVVIRYIKNDNQTVATFLGHVPTQEDDTVLGELKGDFLPDNVLDVVVAPDGKSIAYLLPSADGSVGLSMKTDGTSKKQLFVSPFSEWLLDWNGGGMMATTKASAQVAGYVYSIQKSGYFQKILGNVSGLTTKASPDGKNLLYSVTTNSKLGLYVFHTKDGSGVSLGLSTLPEKCVWAADNTTAYCAVDESAPTGNLPDSWYQGVTHFSDSLWKIDTTSGTTTKMVDGGGMDAIKLSVDPTGKYLLFINKNDGGLWSLDLKPTEQ